MISSFQLQFEKMTFCFQCLLIAVVLLGFIVLAMTFLIQGLARYIEFGHLTKDVNKRFAASLLIVLGIWKLSHPFAFLVIHFQLPPRAENVQKVRIGMTKIEVRNIMGGPIYQSHFDNGDEWYYWFEVIQENGIVFSFDQDGILENARPIMAR